MLTFTSRMSLLFSATTSQATIFALLGYPKYSINCVLKPIFAGQASITQWSPSSGWLIHHYWLRQKLGCLSCSATRSRVDWVLWLFIGFTRYFGQLIAWLGWLNPQNHSFLDQASAYSTADSWVVWLLGLAGCSVPWCSNGIVSLSVAQLVLGCSLIGLPTASLLVMVDVAWDSWRIDCLVAWRVDYMLG